MSLLILGGGDIDECAVQRMLAGLTTSERYSAKRPNRSRSYEAVVVINDQSREAMKHIRHAMELRNATPTLPIMVLTELKPEWSATEAMVRASDVLSNNSVSTDLAGTVIGDSWQNWRTQISDEAITFEYQGTA